MKEFLRTFSYREVLSSLFAALMIVSLFFLIRNFSFHDTKHLLILVVLVPIFLKHRFYFLEHKRRNGIWGRLIHDKLTALFFFVIFGSSLHLVDELYKIGGYINLAIISLSVILFAETSLTIIYQLLYRILKISLW
jgi:hypothetical protein